MSQTNDQTDSVHRALDNAIAGLRQAVPSRPSRPPVDPKAGAGGPNWGPCSPGADSPQWLLLKVANEATHLLKDVETLLVEVTGEPSPIRTRSPSQLPASLLPAIGHLAHEIEVAHAEIGRMVAHLRARL